MGLGCIVSAGIMAKMIAQTNVMVMELTVQTAQKTQAINALRQQLKNCPSGRNPRNPPRSAEYRVDNPSGGVYTPKTLNNPKTLNF